MVIPSSTSARPLGQAPGEAPQTPAKVVSGDPLVAGGGGAPAKAAREDPLGRSPLTLLRVAVGFSRGSGPGVGRAG